MPGTMENAGSPCQWRHWECPTKLDDDLLEIWGCNPALSHAMGDGRCRREGEKWRKQKRVRLRGRLQTQRDREAVSGT